MKASGFIGHFLKPMLAGSPHCYLQDFFCACASHDDVCYIGNLSDLVMNLQI